MNEQKRLTQLSNIRALCIFLVVLGHSIILYSSIWDLYSTDIAVPFLDAMKKCIDPIQMPLFFSLSGYLFVFTHSKKQGFLQLLKNKSLRLLVPYAGVGLLFLLPIRLLIGYPGYQGKTAAQLGYNFLMTFDVGHLWFLPALFFIFLLAELVLTVADRLPGLHRAPDLVLGAAAAVLYLEGYRISLGYPPIQSAYINLIWFAAGYILCVRRELVQTIYRNSAVRWLLAVAGLLLLGYESLVAPMGVLLSVGMKSLFIANIYGIMPNKTYQIIEKVDRCSFDVYLFHSPLIYITFANIPNVHPAIVVFLNLVVFGATAYGLTELVRKSKLKFLIGE